MSLWFVVDVLKCFKNLFVYLNFKQDSQNKFYSWLRMFNFQWPENLSIFLDNLSIYHVCFDLISFITIIFTWWFCKSSSTVENNDRVSVAEESDSINTAAEEVHTCLQDEEDYNFLKWKNDSIVSNIKIMRHKALVKELQSKLTEDELEEEKKMERKQLEKIFQLLQDQEDKFQMTSMEQVEDQLQLYRI